MSQRQLASVEAMRSQVARILNHASFRRSRGPARLLRHLSEVAAASGCRPASQAELADVLGLPKGFDPKSNPLVRMHMSKLRRMLNAYAMGDGRADSVIVELPLNSYCLRATLQSADGLPAESASLAMESGGGRSLVVIVQFEDPGQSTCLQIFSRLLASMLVLELLDNPHLAAIGPLLRDRMRGHPTVSAAVRNCGAPFYIDGNIACGNRGMEVSLRLASSSSGAQLWTDWFDDPADVQNDPMEQIADSLAKRIADRLRDYRIPSAAALEKTLA